MQGVILAGGQGTLLYPLTKVTNKHLLPVYDRPMIDYPLKTLVEAWITEILLVTGGQHAGDFLQLLENGEEFGCSLRYAYQHEEEGIAAALRLAREFAAGEKLAVILGDNLFERGIGEACRTFDLYLREGTLEHSGWWTDAGTFASLHRASSLMEEAQRR